jgi:Family of unknown function (DUF6194)
MVRLSSDDLADAAALQVAITRELAGVVVTSGNGDRFLFYDPDGVTEPDARFPFVTLVTGDRYDAASALDRDARTYRVNLGIGREAYEELLGAAPRQAAGVSVIKTGADYTAVDTVLPHPFYAPLHWLCIVNPGARTGKQLERLLEHAHALAARQYGNRRRA